MRLAVVSPFVDRRHGTERALAELLDRLARTYHIEIHLYALNVKDLRLDSPGACRTGGSGAIFWHKVPGVPGPHLLQFLAWICLNTLRRWIDIFFRGISFDLVLSPGINSLDADLIIVHALFSRLRELSRAEAGDDVSAAEPGVFRRLHRRAYYALLTGLERRIYVNRKIALAGVSQRTADLLAQFFHRRDVSVIPNGVDTAHFSPSARLARRAGARRRHDFRENEFALLLIGNDWRIKGLPAVLTAMAACADLPLRLLVVGQDAPEPYQRLATRLGIRDRCRWTDPCPDALEFYAAADVYASPTHEDAFALPPLEAMACGLPVITSSQNGGSSMITHGADGFVLQDPGDTEGLEGLFRSLYGNASLRETVAANAARTALRWTWDRNAEAVWQVLKDAAARKHSTHMSQGEP